MLRSINWFEHTNRSLLSHFPEARFYSVYLVERLSALLLERLPAEISHSILKLLPLTLAKDHFSSLIANVTPDADSSIGYVDFVKRAESTLGCSDLGKQSLQLGSLDSLDSLDSEDELYKYSEKLTNVFLWAIAQELPAEIKTRMVENLPSELRARMDLFSAQTDEAKVS